MHVVDDIHGLVVDTGYFSQYLLVVGHNFLKLQCLTGQYGNTFHHDSSGIFATSTVDGEQQGLGKVGTCAEELDLFADGLVGYTAGDAVVVAVAHFTHQVVVFVLDGAGIYRNFGAEILEAFRQFGTPQYGQVRFRRRTEVV